MQHMQAQLVTSQIRSFSLAFVLVFGCILIGLRSFKLLLVAIVPNVMPILSTFGVMAVRDIHLDAGTVMVASIALGIAVDDTVHLLAGYRRKRHEGLEIVPAIREALVDVGPSVTVTSVTASIGFFTIATSVFGPLHYFGLLSGVAIVIALLAVLFFVPALLAVFGGRLKGADDFAPAHPTTEGE
jgi:predicted RND superfamily exporter protein